MIQLLHVTPKTVGKFIGLGSTRKVDRFDQFVVKTFLHPLGEKQSHLEQQMYERLYQENLHANVAPILHMDENVCVQPYYRPVPADLGNYAIDFETDPRVTDSLRQAIHLLKDEMDCYDIFDSSNYALNKEGKLMLIDYGMTYEMYMTEWLPLARQGILPQISMGRCESCGVVKELRLYGEDDPDRRCVSCGKI
ncbi:hypothetical protein [Kurthia huakuii]|uniref:hypothetical protein n=1 Tax=Kurthia huakuii TaxID=1421019 RepID=UPI0004954A41|nr:hypothetical protein [Kurthia huakuii]MBM7699728.1 hypothetical protein [Kurthia huakuii]